LSNGTKYFRLLTSPEVDDLDLVQLWFKNFDKLVVSGMGEINFSIIFGFKGHQEAVRKTVFEAFWTIIRTVLEIGYLGDRQEWSLLEPSCSNDPANNTADFPNT